MNDKPTYNQLTCKTKQLEKEVLKYLRKEKELSKKRELVEYHHFKRTISLMKINEELNRELDELKNADKNELEHVSNMLSERIQELKCLYDISSVKAGPSFSLDDVLQEVVDCIPPAIQYPENTCVRIIIDRYYEIKTKNFKNTGWKLSQDINVNNERIGSLEVYYLEENPEIEKKIFFKNTSNLITAIAESIAQIIEREWAEIEIRKTRNKIEELIEPKS